MLRMATAFLVLSLVLAACEKARDPSVGGEKAGGSPPIASRAKEGSGAAPVGGGGQGQGVAASVGAVTRLQSGVEFTVVKPGEGPTPRLGSTVALHLSGRLSDGKVFMDTRPHGVPKEYRLDTLHLIKGLVETILTMRKGERRQVHLPSGLAYGAAGYAGVVPGGADLDFDVELVSFGP